MLISNSDLAELVSGCNSVRGALFRLREALTFLGGCNVAYEYLLWPWSYVRGDLLNATTLPANILELYYPSGGTNTDPIIDQVVRGESFLEVDLATTLADSGSKYVANPFLKKLHEDGCVSLAAWCVSGQGMIGNGAFTVFEDQQQRANRPEEAAMLAFVSSWHRHLQKSRLLGAHFEISEKEARTLESVAAGRTAEDIADRDDVTPRTVEMRLQKLRGKLKARNSSEAVYKAVAHGILPL